ncbi:MAG: DUF3299 domain-containing protein [Burkholderiaceae bacterium]
MPVPPILKTALQGALTAIVVGLLAVGVTQAALPESPSEIDWQQLVPAQSPALIKDIETLQQALDDLDEERQELYFQIDDQMALKRRIERGFIDETLLNDASRKQLNKDLKSEQPELFTLWERVNKTRQRHKKESARVNESLDGKTVRMPGYVLPLESEGTAVREFLLVPFVGACIHVPPPPPNQMVFVESAQPYESDALFEPVWVEGVLTVSAGTHSLSLVDGESDVNTGYSMKAIKIIKHQQ